MQQKSSAVSTIKKALSAKINQNKEKKVAKELKKQENTKKSEENKKKEAAELEKKVQEE